tara:strand:- start:986 stop:1189 length:204 start_codon:yes stop_codon:yes gene_type:complete
MQNFMTNEEVQAKLNENKDLKFTTREIMMIKISAKFLLKHFYADDMGTMTYEELVSIRDKCINALEK